MDDLLASLSFFFPFRFFSWYPLKVLQDLFYLNFCQMIIIFYPVQLLIFTLRWSVCGIISWIYVVSIFAAILQKVILLYNCETIVILYQINWLILYFFLSICFFFYLDYWRWLGCACFYELSCCVFVNCKLSFITFIYSLLTQFCMLFLSVFITAANMFDVILCEVITLFIREMIIFLPKIPIDSLLVFISILVLFIWFKAAAMLFAVWQEMVYSNVCETIIIIHHWSSSLIETVLA